MDPASAAAEINAAYRSAPQQNTAGFRQVRRKYSSLLAGESPEAIFNIANELIKRYNMRWIAYELIQTHKTTMRSLRIQHLENLGRGMASWDEVDSFARTLSGPAWKAGQVADQDIYSWATSPDRWWRRAALVSTVAFNMKSHGGTGDTPHTLAVCQLLVDDHDDMVVKALSWALRELVEHDPESVRSFLAKNDYSLAGRIKRETQHKLNTGLKNPRKKDKNTLQKEK